MNKTNQSTLQNHLKSVVYGGSDGIVTTFAVVAGFSGAGGLGVETYGFLAIILFGFANLFADASSMGLGDYLSNRSQRDVRRKAEAELRAVYSKDPDMIRTRLVKVLNKKGMEKSEAATVVNNMFKTPELIYDMLLSYELDIPESEDQPITSALATFFSFIVFGLIPLLPFLFLQEEVGTMFNISVLGASIALVLLGLLRWKVTGINWLRAVLESLIIGGLAATIAFAIGFWIA